MRRTKNLLRLMAAAAGLLGLSIITGICLRAYAAEHESVVVILMDEPTDTDGVTKDGNAAASDAAADNMSTPATRVNEYTAIADSMTESERVLLERIVAAESQTQGMEGRKAVVEVIFNRVLDDKFPDTVYGVLSQKGAFASWKYRNASWVVPELGADAVAEVVRDGRTVLPDTGYVFFSRGKSRLATNFIKIQDHWFGRAKK